MSAITNNTPEFDRDLFDIAQRIASDEAIIKSNVKRNNKSVDEAEREHLKFIPREGKKPEEVGSIRDNQRMISEEKERRIKELDGMSTWDKFKSGFGKAIGEGSVDHRKAFWAARELQSLDEEAPKLMQILGINPTFTRVRDALGISNIEDRVSRERAGLGLEKDGWAKTGQLAGTLGADLIQDRTRNLYWLLNAPQAVANVSQEWGLAHNAPELYQSDKVTWKNGEEITLEPKNYQELVHRGLIGVSDEGHVIMRGGANRIQGSKDGTTAISKRRYRPGAVDALAIPSGIAINAGVGLLDPLGGSNGYSAVFEREDDPTKTSNVVGEIAAKYILGRTGNMLPWDEFKKVRPDVSKDEYMRYKAFKYDKEGDADLSDGTFTVPTGILKGTTEGIHGPEIQMLGRSMPLLTTLLPTVAAGVGTTLGARWEPEEFNDWRKTRDRATAEKDHMVSEANRIFKNKDLREKKILSIKSQIAEAKQAEFNRMPEDIRDGKTKQERFKSINRVRNGLVSGLASYGTALVGGLALENERRRRNENENESKQQQL